MNQECNQSSDKGALSADKTKKQQEKSKARKWALVVSIPVVLILVVVFILYSQGYFSLGGEPALDSSSVVVGSNIKEGTPGMTEEELQEALDEEREASMISIEIGAYPTFEDGASEGYLNIVNPAVNSLYLEVEIRLDDTGEVIYESGVIPPNSYIDYDKLSTVLKKGEYSATAYVNAHHPESPDTQYNQAEFSLVVTILN